MANEPGNKGPGSSSSSADSYIGSFISLISKYEIRYEGVLCYINTQDSTIRLKNVRSYGTEGRKKDSPQIPPSDKVFDYILFRGSDIKDLQVKSSPPQTEEHIHYDPAIIQSQYASGSSSSPVSASVDVASSESSCHQDTPALTSRIHPPALSSYQSAAQVGPSAHSQTAQLAGVPYFATPLYWQGNGTSIGVSHAPQHPVPVQPTTVSFPSMMQNSLQAPEFKAAECASLVPTLVASTSVHPKLSPPVTPEQYSSSPIDMPSTLSLNSSISSHSTSLASNRLSMPSFSASRQDINTKEALTVGKVVSGQASGLPFQSSQLSAPVPLMVPPQTLLTQTQVGQASLSVPCSLQNSTDMGARTLSLAISTPILQMPLLPLPPSAQKLPNSTTQYTEEFDFIAMNEKFRKDEVWGYLGKAKQSDKMGWTKDDTVDQKMGDHEVNIPDNDATPAYSKDEFFDTISCNAHTRGVRYGQHRWFERMQRDTETFGTSHHRPQGGFDGYGAGRGVNYRGSYNLGRGYGYRGRGHGRNRNM